MRGKFEIFKDRKDGFRFRLKATNGQTILASQGYTTKAKIDDLTTTESNGQKAAPKKKAASIK